MARARSTIRPSEIKISIPMDLSARLDTLLWDPVLQKPRYGARAELATKLFTIWCEQQETGIESEPELRTAIAEGTSS